MPNPLNPLNWLKATQDWFSRTEKSSGFRAYLIFLILVFGGGLCLVTFGGSVEYAAIIGLAIIAVSVVAFIVLYFVKALSDPDFCRSEQHVQKMIQFELERMGNESRQLEGHVIEAQMVAHAEPEPKQLPDETHGAAGEEVTR
ncbi:MAG: hypothetical protein PHR35_15575 [Kiritimatiellae bacterium]|nr:hypothetical protein [Kiritimatiellia bacterium]